VRGTLTNQNTSEPIAFAQIYANCNGNTYCYALTDEDGNFNLDNLPNGTCTLRFFYELTDFYYKDTIHIDSQSSLVYFIKEKLNVVPTPIDPPYLHIQIRFRPAENPVLGPTEIEQSVNKFQLEDLLLGMSSQLTNPAENQLSFHGTENNDYLQFIDGVKCRGLYQFPAASMKSVTLMTNFIPAKYGDITGGVILIETMSYMDLYNEWERRQDW
jgi:hypothetical protein